MGESEKCPEQEGSGHWRMSGKGQGTSTVQEALTGSIDSHAIVNAKERRLAIRVVGDRRSGRLEIQLFGMPLSIGSDSLAQQTSQFPDGAGVYVLDTFSQHFLASLFGNAEFDIGEVDTMRMRDDPTPLGSGQCSHGEAPLSQVVVAEDSHDSSRWVLLRVASKRPFSETGQTRAA